MKRNIMNEAEKLIKAHRRKKRWYQAVTCLAGIVVFCTVYSLILPAITMEKYQCGIEEHTHTQECYDAEGSLICGLEEHVHTDACVRSEETAENGTEETADTTTENTSNAATSEKVETVETAETTESSETADSTETENAGSETENTESDTTQEDTETTVDTGTSETEKTAEKTEDTKTDETAQDTETQDTETQEEWEATFQSVELTGKYPEDVLAIAKTQIGYTESTENYVTDETGEARGYTRYGQWYGEPYGEWSGMFASFCLHYAGVEGMPLSDDCEEWIKELSKEEYSLYHEASDTEYEPVPGDLVFFDLDGDTKADHTGIISEVNISETENELKTIEGDWEDKVQTVTRSADDEKILGYGALPEQEKEEEQTEENAQAQDFELSVETENGITVTVSGSGDALPYPAGEVTLKAEEIKDREAVDIQSQALEDAGLKPKKEYLFDITLWHEEEEIEPTGTVTVGFEGFDTEGTEAKVYHIDEKKERAEDMEATVDDEGTVVLDTDHFSVYGVALLADGQGISGDISGINGGTYHLTGDAFVEANATINITQNTTLDLNGHGVYYNGTGSCINVSNRATLTIKDSGDTSNTTINTGRNLYGNIATLTLGGDNVNQPAKLKYYVTESTVNSDGISTSETLKEYMVNMHGKIGFIIGQAAGGAASIVNVSQGSTFNMEGGVLTIKNYSSNMNSHIVSNNGTFNMNDGYICGATANSYGGGVYTDGTMTMKGGVIAANYSNNGGGICVGRGIFTMEGGIVSGNSLRQEAVHQGKTETGYGGGIYAMGGVLNLSGGYITNNSMPEFCGEDGQGDHGGGGIAIVDATLNMTGGYVTGNYSAEAGGGLYLGKWESDTVFNMSGGIVAANCAENSEGGGIRVSGGTEARIDTGSTQEKAYITNNRTNTNFDWGGGGIFVQQDGELNIINSLITENTANGYGGGVGACPTGETLISHTQGTAIYDNKDNSMAFSGGGHGKDADSNVAAADPNFIRGDNRYHADYFCVRDTSQANGYITLVTGKMLGGGAANWTGTVDGQAVEISGTGSAAATYLFGLTADPEPEAVEKAKTVAGVIISGNYSGVHGGGIMTNGGLILGEKQDTDVFPGLRINATKELFFGNNKQNLVNGQFEFDFYNGTGHSKPVWNSDGTLNTNGCTLVETIKNDQNGNLSFDLGDFTESGDFTYYMIERPGNASSYIYDKTIYEIKIKVELDKSETLLGVTFRTYKITKVLVTTHYENGGNYIDSSNENPNPNSDGTVSITIKKGNPSDNNATFTNEYKGYVLPETGGVGTKLYTIGGLLLIMGAGSILLYRSKKGRGGASS